MDSIENALAGLKSESFTSEEIFAEIQQETAGGETVHLDYPTDLLGQGEQLYAAEEEVFTEAEQVANQEQTNRIETEISIEINNVVGSFSVRCHLNLRHIAMEGTNVEYRRENAMVTMKIRRPYTTASMWSSGKLTVTGATSEPDSRIAARRFSRKLQRLGYKVRLANFRVVNVLATCRMPFAIRIAQFSQAHRANASYEPELHPGVTYKIKEIKAVLKIFSTGSITVTAPSVSNVEMAIHQIFPLVVEHQMEKLKVKDKFELNVHKHNIVAGRKRKHRGGALPRQLKKSRTNEGTSLSECDTDTDCDSGGSFDSNESAD